VSASTETRGRAKRQLVEQARKLAVEGRWAEALEVNKRIIERSQKDVDAYNRLGKAYFELHKFRSAYEAYRVAAGLDPANVIARRNIDRIEPVKDQESEDEAGDGPPVRYGIFIEEVGRTYLDDLVNITIPDVLIHITSGEELKISIEGSAVSLFTAAGEYIGQLEPRIARRVVELTEMGNQYEVFVTSCTGTNVRVIVREAFRHPSMGYRMSFPKQGKVAIPRAYLRDTRLFRGDEPELLLGDEEDEEVDAEEADEYETTEGDEDETEYVDESAAAPVVDEEEEETI
jgi:tetratricopeptide (TPR) repeat protein